MTQMEKAYFEKRGQILVKNLRNRHFDAWYCDTKEDALAKVLELIPEGAKIGRGGVLSAQQIGLFDALRAGNYNLLDRDLCQTQEEREQMMKDALFSDVFLTGANGLSLDGQMVNIDGTGNRVSATLYGHKKLYIIIGVNKIAPDYDAALWRARNIAAPKNAQRLKRNTPCAVNADRCYNCKSPDRICNGLVVFWHKMRGIKDVEVVIINQELGY